MRPIKFIFLIALVFFACGNQTPPSDKADELTIPISGDSLAKLLKEIHASEKAYQLDTLFKNKVTAGFNGCVLVAQRGQVIYKQAFGFKDLKTNDSLHLNAAFQLASVSKTLTAAAILLLVDQGKLKLTDSIQQFFPQFPYHHITVKLLLSHRSGLSNYVYFCESYCKKTNRYKGELFNNNALLDIMIHSAPAPYAAPNKKFEYCNTNYALLASIVEKVSGMKFADFMKQNIFQPLGMNDTWIHDSKTDAAHKNKTRGHSSSGKYEDDFYADDVLGDKGVYSTVEDLFKWDQALYSQRLLKKETIAAAFTGYSNEHPGKRNYGYGWRLIDDGKAPKIMFHNGWWHGYATLFYRRPADQTTVIVLSNKFTRSTYRIEGVWAILNGGASTIDIEGEE
jgi:CubicO group peptidase (beta-lactamase class C family)